MAGRLYSCKQAAHSPFREQCRICYHLSCSAESSKAAATFFKVLMRGLDSGASTCAKADERRLPFEVKEPNKVTVEAMAELEAGKGQRFNSVAEMMAALDADD